MGRNLFAIQMVFMSESVKRTDSIRNIVRKYYHHFLEERDFDCDKNELDETDMEDVDNEEDKYELEEDNFTDVNQCSCKCKKNRKTMLALQWSCWLS